MGNFKCDIADTKFWQLKKLERNNMKNLYLSFCLMFISTLTFSQWTVMNSGVTKHLTSVFFTDSITGYSVGLEGTIIKTINGGKNWNLQNSSTTNTLTSIYFTSPDTGYIVGDWGTILTTTNGGINWEKQISGTSLPFNSVYFTDLDTGYIAGSAGAFLKTTDGGKTWISQFIDSASMYSLNSVYFIDSNNGTLVGGRWDSMGGSGQVILKTTDGGSNWIRYLSGMSDMLFSVVMTDAKTVYTVGGKIILRSINQGVNWTLLNSNTAYYLHSVFFTDINTGYTVGDNGLVLKTINEGINWLKQTSVVNNTLLSVYFTDVNIGYAVGFNGTILKTKNGGDITNAKEIHQPVSSCEIFPNPADDEITIVNKNVAIETQISIYNIQGKLIIENKYRNQNSFEYNISGFSKGIYLVKIQTENMIENKKFIIQK